MATNPDINSDLEPAVNDIPTPVETVDVPESEPGARDWNVFGPDEEEEQEAAKAQDLFDEEPETKFTPQVAPSDRNLSASVLAIALSDPAVSNDITLLSEANLEMARGLLENQQEYNARLRVAANRSIDTLKYLDEIRTGYERRAQQGETIPEGVRELVDQTYNDVTQSNTERRAAYAAEMETVERVRDFMTNGDIHEAYLVRSVAFNGGGAEQQLIDHMTRQLILAQRAEELETEYEDSDWIRGFFNGVLRAVPLLDSFSAAGILDDAGIEGSNGGIINFILRGENLKDQREVLLGLPMEDFAEAMAADGPVMKAIRENASWLMDDPARAQEVGAILLSQKNDGAKLENFFGGLDAVLLGGGMVGRTTGILKGLGAAKASRDLTTKAVLETLQNGPQAAKRATSLGADEVMDNLTPSAFRADATGVGMSADVVASLRTAEEIRRLFPDLMATNRFNSADEIQAAYESVEKSLMKEKYGKFIKDVTFVEENIRTGASKTFAGEVAADGATIHKVVITAGKKDGGGYAKPGYAKGLDSHFGREGTVWQDPVSKQWFNRYEVEVPADGFITGTLDTPDAALTFLRSSAVTADRSGVARGVVAGNAANLFKRKVADTIKNSMKGLSRKERNALNQVIMKGQNEAKWYDEAEFGQLYERTHGREPSKQAFEAYSVYRSMNDVDYLVRNEALYLRKYNEGFSSHKFSFEGNEVDVDGVLMTDPKKRPAGSQLWDADARRWLPENIPSSEIKKMVDEGYVMLRLDNPLNLPDKSLVRHVMVKKGGLKSRPLRRTQLNYSEGGSRAYKATHFIKQAMEDVGGNLISPRAHIAGSNLNEMKAWAQTMNGALELAAKGEKDPFRFDDIFQNRKGFPTGEEFMEMVDTGKISTKHKFEVVEDQGMPSAYFGKGQDALKYVDMDEVAIDQYYRSNGNMYYGSKGEALKDTTGEFAETIDPWETLNSSLSEASRTYSFSGYKQNMLERFKNTYGQFLENGGASDTYSSLYRLATADVAQGVDSKIASRIKQEQSAIRRLMNFQTGFEKDLAQRWRRAADWVLGDAAENSIRGHTRSFMYWLDRNNPVQAIRSFTFDSNLGFFNIGQLFIQSSTLMSAMALSPRHGAKGLSMVPTMKMYAVSGYRDDVLDTLAKNGAWKGSFDTADEFKEYAKFLRDSNLYEVSGHNLAQLREYGADRLFGATGAYNAVAEKGRMFFYFAEQANRSVSSRIAWEELKERGLKPGTAKFRDEFSLLTDDYSFNMMSQTSAGFQHGLTSIPTQFWAYSFRMMDALMGKRFTTQQKVRLLTMNMAMGGAAGVPGGALIAKLYEEYTGGPVSIEEADGWLARGVIDGLVHTLTEADVEIGKKIGSADLITNVIKDVMGTGEYGEKTVLEMAMGAAGGKLGSALPALADVVKYSAAENGVGGPLEKEVWLRLAREIATFKNGTAAYNAALYDTYVSKSGQTIAADLPDADAFFFALGFTPGEQGRLGYYFDQNDSEEVEEAAKMLNRWRQDAFTYPDKYEESRQKAQAFMSLYPPHQRMAIKRRAQRIESPSLYDSVTIRFEKDLRRDEFIDNTVSSIQEETNTGYENLENN